MGRIGLLIVLILAISAWPLSAQDTDTAGFEFFEKSVRPILVKRCYECHSGERTKGGLALDSRAGWQKGGDDGPSIVPGKPDESSLIDAINYRSHEMPPKDKGGKLPDDEIAILTEWVTRGAPDPREQVQKLGGMKLSDVATWWSFQPLSKQAAPLSSADIDRQINLALSEHQIAPNPPADKRTLIRRVTYDLIGLPPTNDEVEAFVNDSSPEAYSHLIERLLASPQYGVKWGRHWLDVVRYADTAGENTDRPLPHAWRYRNWVIDSFNRDLPYDEFVRLQLAGDLLRKDASPQELSEGIVATGYLALARRFGHDIDKDIHLTYEDAIDNLGKGFLGLTLGCARCHDHKYDPVMAADYYALYGILDSSRFSFPGCEPKGQPRDLVPLLSTAEIDRLMAPWKQRVAEIEVEKKRRAESMVSTDRMKEMAASSTRRLAEAKVGEGADVPIVDANGNELRSVAIRRGEVVQLTILPNDNHGADTTLVNLSIKQAGGGPTWNVSDLIPTFTQANPANQNAETAWCFVEATNGPTYLVDKHEEISGNKSLKSWSLGELPSVFVNSATEPVAVWTSLPPRSVFVHPGPNRPVAIAWVCPRDGSYDILGHVADAHPAALDGVSYQLDLVAAAEFGQALVSNGEILAKPTADAGPEPTIPVAYAVIDAAPKNARIHQRGEPEVLGPEVPRRWLSAFGEQPVPENAGSGRRELADWIIQSPLSARVMVNRIWLGHFGQGLVRTPNDFGSRGERPTHPELLDGLASHFANHGYSIKGLHRLILNTDAYRRSSARPQSLVDVDPNNRLLGRFERRRLSAEEIRDSLLFVSGKLDFERGQQHPFPPESTWKFTQHTPFNAIYETNGRSVYLMTQRQRRHPFLTLFDGADTNSSTASRQTTTMPTQALYFMNDPFFHQQSDALAARTANVNEERQRVVSIYQFALQRMPTADEQIRAAQFVSDYPADATEKWTALARVILAGNEFLHVD